ncbi:MAG: L,D-transpeptidase family protein [Ethanoligenens sp.]
MKKKLENLLIAILSLLLMANVISIFQHTLRANGQRTPTTSPNPYIILIQVQENRLSLFKNGKLYHSYSCATGKTNTPSPSGTFQINRKARWGEGFGGYFLGLNCPWGNYGIHGTTRQDSVGQSSSHGCFRMYDKDIRALYTLVPYGTTVLIVNGIYGAFGTGFRTIGPGMYGQDVFAVQKRLRNLGYFTGSCNGRYDSWGFHQAVLHFERDQGLQQSDCITAPFYKALGFYLIE